MLVKRDTNIDFLNHMPSGILVTDGEGFIEVANFHAETMFGYEAGELLGLSIEALIPEDLREKHVNLRTNYLAHPYTRMMGGGLELCGRRKNGEAFPIEVGLSYFPQGDRIQVVCTISDISGRRQVDALLQDSTDEVKRNARRSEMLDYTLKENERMSQELAVAKEVQGGFMPSELPHIPGWQLAATLKPARETSGDFIDVRLLSEQHLGILVADVVDKGVGAALFMALSWILLRTYAERYPLEPEHVLSAVNYRILRETNSAQYVTAFYGILDLAEGKLAYCNAGHPAPVLIQGKKRSRFQELSNTGAPIGLFRNENWEQQVVEFNPGDELVIYTDGITEAKNSQGLFFEETRLLQSVMNCPENSAQKMLDSILADVQSFAGEAPQQDDIALVVISREKSLRRF